MRFLALATDFDGTLTTTGVVGSDVVAALRKLRISGRKALLVTGRLLDDLLDTCCCIDNFDYVVAENGALLYHPPTGESTLLAHLRSGDLAEALRRRGVEPLEIGRATIATRVPHETTVLQLIREAGLELQVVFNRGAVMVLPPGVNKATGLRKALGQLGLSLHEVVSIGDAENDHSFLRDSECAVAVSNAIESIKNAAAFVTQGAAGQGVVELIGRLIATDLEEIDSHLTHHYFALGKRLDGHDIEISPYGRNILIAGPSGSGKSSLASGFVERLARQFYQVCIIDPEGDYVGLPHVVTLGDESRVPSYEEIMAVLRDPGVNLNINLLGVRLPERPAFFSGLLPYLRAMRARTSRPHWLVIDEAHHLMPGTWGTTPVPTPTMLNETILVTVHPDHLATSILPMIDVVVAVGDTPNVTLSQFTNALGHSALEQVDWQTNEHRVACWFTRNADAPFSMEIIHARAERIRHHRKYAMGELGHRGFFFRGPEKRLNLKAQNLAMFCQIAEGIDDATWLFHLKKGDYSSWLTLVIKDDEIADLARELERRHDLSAGESRLILCDAIGSRYSLPE
ncbi:MAG: HAD family hydrolase [Acidobacteriota bacterium]